MGEEKVAMANNVVVQVLGGSKKVLDNVHSVADVKSQVGAQAYAASINGDPATDGSQLSDGDFVSLSQAVKGGLS
jgi:sulfur carrier protein ThiS